MPKKFIRFQVTTQEHASFTAHAARLNEKLDVWARRTLLREMGIELKEARTDSFLKVFPNGTNLNAPLSDDACSMPGGIAIVVNKPEQTVSDAGIPVSQPEPAPENIKAMSDKVFHENADGTPRDPIQPQLVAPPDKTKPISMAERMYQIIEKRDGKAAADAYMDRIKERAAIDQSVPDHLKSFYKTIVATQGEEAGKLWLLTNLGGKKISV